MRTYSLAYLTVNTSSAPQAVSMAAELGYGFVGLRLQANAPGAPHQSYLEDVAVQRETLARMKDTGVQVFDLEIIRIGPQFEPLHYRALLEAGAALKARAVLVAADDTDEHRLAQNYARLCEFTKPYGLSADLEFMPWTGVKDAAAALRVVDLAGRPDNAGILVDALHFGRSATRLADIAALPPQLLHYAQMCDAPAGLHFSTDEMIHSARQQRMLPGEGSIDVKGLFAALPADIPVSVEIPEFQRAARLGEKTWARQALQATKQALGDLD
ncbi:xylose isomerase [Rhodoferax lacus]|uniref:Xylose isomerase n=1 Tax=Rhodoferax lacus TaxID=2184758 RepID=A0A3E1RCZ0_9BURK|nr:TIM barrel protein [Rhodoferax lacus]RFO97237.1 xylose isomerase [Rhodoferax lacus]